MRRNHNATYINVVLDRSGSMAERKNDVIGGFNTFLEEQKKVGGEAFLTLVQFDNVIEVVEDTTPIDNVQPLTDQTYVPRNTTALFDGLGKAIADMQEKLGDMTQRPKQVIFLIMTDGHENASKEWSKDDVQSMVEMNTDWEFIYIGADLATMRQGSGLGIGKSVSRDYTDLRSSFGNLSREMTRYRNDGNATDFNEDKI